VCDVSIRPLFSITKLGMSSPWQRHQPRTLKGWLVLKTSATLPIPFVGLVLNLGSVLHAV
jgi:hypothetical protein